MSIIWQLANTVSVLEDSYGFKAMSKSRQLLRGNMVLGVVFFLKLHLALFVVNVIFKRFVANGWHFDLGMSARIGFGLMCLLVLFKLVVFGLVTQTVIYFVCKSYHHENIDKSTLSDLWESIFVNRDIIFCKTRRTTNFENTLMPPKYLDEVYYDGATPIYH
nr:Forkhead box protein [Ipomoea batatas]